MKKRKVIKENDAKLKMVNFLSQQFNLDQEIINILVDIFKLKKYKKKELIISDTENIDKVCYIVGDMSEVNFLVNIIFIYINKTIRC